MEENTQRKQQLKGQNSFVAHGPHHEHRLDMMFIKHLEDQNYDTTMVCVDVFTKYAAVVPVNGKSENVLALGVIESIAKMSKKPQVIYLDSESGIRNSRLFQKVLHRNSKSPCIAAEGIQRLLSGSSAPSNPCWTSASKPAKTGLT